MRYLYGLLILSLAALLWAAMAIARHIKQHDEQAAASDSEVSQVGSDATAAVAEHRTSEAAKALSAEDTRSTKL